MEATSSRYLYASPCSIPTVSTSHDTPTESLLTYATIKPFQKITNNGSTLVFKRPILCIHCGAHINSHISFPSTNPSDDVASSSNWLCPFCFESNPPFFPFSILSQTSHIPKLNQLQIAEMVTTFIQEIPYVLVHQNSCQQIIKSAPRNSFVVTYHNEHKPCLANIPGGIQSPYEFLHNLKGDCDTRSVLGYSILTEMHIPASVWVSEAYGHSVLGVGLPVGTGSYKEIDGMKHYAVELTSKGYRLGMISASNRNMNNWTITLYKNN
jgi:hypothetical protein